jgi:hypothetical protein
VVWRQNHWDDFLPFGLKTGGDSFSRFGLKIGGFGFPGLGLKTGGYGLVICASKSPRQFLGLELKTKWAMVCRLRLKIDRRMEPARGTHQDLATCFAWKQVGLGFPSLPQNRQRHNGGWCTWHHHSGCIEIKLKMDGSMRRATSDPSTPKLMFSLY